MLLRRGLFQTLDREYGARVGWRRAYLCPMGDPGCSVCAEPRDARRGYHYEAPVTVAHAHSLVRAPDDPELREALDHRWLTTPAAISWTDPSTNVTTSYVENVDFDLSGRLIVWRPGKGPPKRATYTVSYTARHEDDVHLIHAALASAAGGSSVAERGRQRPWGEVQQGQIALSIPPEARAYNTGYGDIVVPVDSEMRFDQLLRVGGRLKADNEWVVRVDRAWTVDRDGTETELAVTFDRATTSWVLPAGLEDDLRISIAYVAAPLYTIYLDAGEFRSAGMKQQPRLIILDRVEIVRG